MPASGSPASGSPASGSPASGSPAGAPPRIAVKDLRKNFSEIEVIRGISFDAMAGEVVTLIGSSGSGKSTVLRCLNLLEAPTAGTIMLDGQPVAFTVKHGRVKLTPAVRQLRAALAMVFQSFNLWNHLTARENVMIAPIHVLGLPRKAAEARADSLLARVGLYDRRDHYPHQLSGGQQQRTAIARALAMAPKILLFDEPTSSLDPELVGEVLDVIQGLAEAGNTMVLVTHEMRFARDISSKILFLNDGLVEESGPPSQIFGAPKTERCAQFLASAS